MADEEVQGFLRGFRELVEMSHRLAGGAGERFGEVLERHFGQTPSVIAVLTEEVLNHRYADWDTALEVLSGRDPAAHEVGVGGGDMRYHQTLTDFAAEAHGRTPLGQVDYVSIPVGPKEYRRAIGFGMRLFRYQDVPVGVMQRRAHPRYGQPKGSFELMCPDPDVAAALLGEARELAVQHSVLRGQVITLEMSGYGPESEGIAFLERPEIPADHVILPMSSLERIVAHVTGVAEHADVLRRHGQHLKRGLLLYGPPGTGKTHTVRHLISRNPGHTVVVLAGETLRFISLAANLARALQPAIVVLEDCDLVAEDRGQGPSGRPLLFEVLDAMDGLDADADVTFLLTTNRVEALERALVQRPGRVDLAVEVPLPDQDGRRRLLDLYRGHVSYSAGALEEAAARTGGMTASFTKELMRRSVLEAAVAGQEPGDEHLARALDGLLSGHEELTRVLLGGTGPEATQRGPSPWEQSGGQTCNPFA
ncbi:AAA family ATPase [Ornithinimicrobium pratense]|nr:ATP-binding protein [Ornithinimicrobium pratense]